MSFTFLKTTSRLDEHKFKYGYTVPANGINLAYIRFLAYDQKDLLELIDLSNMVYDKVDENTIINLDTIVTKKIQVLDPLETDLVQSWFLRIKPGWFYTRYQVKGKQSDIYFKNLGFPEIKIGDEFLLLYSTDVSYIKNTSWENVNTRERKVEKELCEFIGEKTIKTKYNNLTNIGAQAIYYLANNGTKIPIDATNVNNKIETKDLKKGIITFTALVGIKDDLYIDYTYIADTFNINYAPQFLGYAPGFVDFSSAPSYSAPNYNLISNNICLDINPSLGHQGYKFINKPLYIYLKPIKVFKTNGDSTETGLAPVWCTTNENIFVPDKIVFTEKQILGNNSAIWGTGGLYGGQNTVNPFWDPTAIPIAIINLMPPAKTNWQILDSRSRGGGIRENMTEAEMLTAQPEYKSYWDCGNFGTAYLENGVLCVFMPKDILVEEGGYTTKTEVEKTVTKYLAKGIMPIITYVDRETIKGFKGAENLNIVPAVNPFLGPSTTPISDFVWDEATGGSTYTAARYRKYLNPPNANPKDDTDNQNTITAVPRIVNYKKYIAYAEVTMDIPDYDVYARGNLEFFYPNTIISQFSIYAYFISSGLPNDKLSNIAAEVKAKNEFYSLPENGGYAERYTLEFKNKLNAITETNYSLQKSYGNIYTIDNSGNLTQIINSNINFENFDKSNLYNKYFGNVDTFPYWPELWTNQWYLIKFNTSTLQYENKGIFANNQYLRLVTDDFRVTSNTSTYTIGSGWTVINGFKIYKNNVEVFSTTTNYPGETYLEFLDTNKGFLIVENGTNNTLALAYTIDGGNTWSVGNGNLPNGVFRIYSVSNTEKYAFGYKIYKTTDNGVTWLQLSAPLTNFTVMEKINNILYIATGGQYSVAENIEIKEQSLFIAEITDTTKALDDPSRITTVEISRSEESGLPTVVEGVVFRGATVAEGGPLINCDINGSFTFKYEGGVILG